MNVCKHVWMANQQIYTTIPMASKHCLPRLGKLGADMKSPSQVALVALLPGERKRQREKRYCKAGRDRAKEQRGHTERNQCDGDSEERQGRTAKSYWAAATASAILFQLAFATSENAQKMENYARCCRVAKWQAEQAATWRLADLVSLYFHCQNRKQVKIVRQKSIVDILSLSLALSF